jgi:hypothetical protein
VTWPGVEQNWKWTLRRFIDVPVGLLTALIDRCGCCGGSGQERVHLEDVRVDEEIILKCM